MENFTGTDARMHSLIQETFQSFRWYLQGKWIFSMTSFLQENVNWLLFPTVCVCVCVCVFLYRVTGPQLDASKMVRELFFIVLFLRPRERMAVKPAFPEYGALQAQEQSRVLSSLIFFMVAWSHADTNITSFQLHSLSVYRSEYAARRECHMFWTCVSNREVVCANCRCHARHWQTVVFRHLIQKNFIVGFQSAYQLGMSKSSMSILMNDSWTPCHCLDSLRILSPTTLSFSWVEKQAIFYSFFLFFSLLNLFSSLVFASVFALLCLLADPYLCNHIRIRQKADIPGAAHFPAGDSDKELQQSHVSRHSAKIHAYMGKNYPKSREGSFYAYFLARTYMYIHRHVRT